MDLTSGYTIDKGLKLKISDVVEFLKEESKDLPRHMYDYCGIAVGALKDAIDNIKEVK